MIWLSDFAFLRKLLLSLSSAGTKASLDLASHVFNFVHAFAVFLYSIHFVRMVAVDRVHQVALHPVLRVLMCLVHETLVFVVCRFLSVVVGREHAGERVAHLQLSVERRVEARHSSFIKTTFTIRVLRHRTVRVVLVIIRKAQWRLLRRKHPVVTTFVNIAAAGSLHFFLDFFIVTT